MVKNLNYLTLSNNMFLAVNHANGTLKCDDSQLCLTYVLVASPPVSPVGQRIQPPASLSIEDVVEINNGRRPPE